MKGIFTSASIWISFRVAVACSHVAGPERCAQDLYDGSAARSLRQKVSVLLSNHFAVLNDTCSGYHPLHPLYDQFLGQVVVPYWAIARRWQQITTTSLYQSYHASFLTLELKKPSPVLISPLNYNRPKRNSNCGCIYGEILSNKDVLCIEYESIGFTPPLWIRISAAFQACS